MGTDRAAPDGDGLVAPTGQSGAGLYGPDGMPLDVDTTVGEDKHGHQSVEINEQGWFHAESNRLEQEQLAQIHLSAICRAVDERHMSGLCRDGRWTNDPETFPDLQLRGTVTSNAVIPFPPHDQQYYVCGIHDPATSNLRTSAIPSHVPDEDGNSTWVRLVDFADHADATHLFDESCPHRTHYGRVIQGALDNGYFVEALQAIALRPKLARQLFHCWDARRSVYIARLFKHGTWMRVEVDDYVPVGAPAKDSDEGNVPICCRSEFFPYVLWPSIIEKAYAKVHTLRGSTISRTDSDRGGWVALGGGGRVEEALADLTGGVAGRFSTSDVTMDRLFIYIYELQRDTLFVCRPHQMNCELHGVRLNPYYPNIVNRAVTWEGRLFVQLFSGAPGVYDGGLQDISVPYSLVHAPEYPETTAEGFFWITAQDFHEYFDTIFECRLVNSGDVSICSMPPPRMQASMPVAPGMVPGMGMPMPGSGLMRMPGPPLGPWFEWVYANPGEITRHNEPEFSVRVPERDVPCDIICSVEQIDPRMLMTTSERRRPPELLVKVYENVESSGRNRGGFYSKNLVCRSNWLPVRDAVVAFSVIEGCEFKILAEVPTLDTKVDRLIFRCYSSRPNVTVSAGTGLMKHALVEPNGPPRGQKRTLVGVAPPNKWGQDDVPMPLDEEHDSLRKPEFDMAIGWSELKQDLKDCCLM
uniref:Calpain catalytic domain-containing protein n=1 Tax=Pyrodinium bahamense TaxID=73915 RepID=A0A7S0FYE2_9DINO|mmetsp:Transcript_6155/g.16743  ORF Transcript_6155/g.16743 Transcript_6155/m.16743 type:complete len:696 (+) Transcript_6155:75-2162(+)